ncbi:Uncharacterised protein [Nocardia africana]|uniref:Uncharacterized protein n=3 Tax=Nocardia africana TaxID=134964 RepID=A0A378WNA0_9NOCA|nr:Uncharacterised protein [Nocardia africana]
MDPFYSGRYNPHIDRYQPTPEEISAARAHPPGESPHDLEVRRWEEHRARRTEDPAAQEHSFSRPRDAATAHDSSAESAAHPERPGERTPTSSDGTPHDRNTPPHGPSDTPHDRPAGAPERPARPTEHPETPSPRREPEPATPPRWAHHDPNFLANSMRPPEWMRRSATPSPGTHPAPHPEAHRPNHPHPDTPQPNGSHPETPRPNHRPGEPAPRPEAGPRTHPEGTTPHPETPRPSRRPADPSPARPEPAARTQPERPGRPHPDPSAGPGRHPVPGPDARNTPRPTGDNNPSQPTAHPAREQATHTNSNRTSSGPPHTGPTTQHPAPHQALGSPPAQHSHPAPDRGSRTAWRRLLGTLGIGRNTHGASPGSHGPDTPSDTGPHNGPSTNQHPGHHVPADGWFTQHGGDLNHPLATTRMMDQYVGEEIPGRRWPTGVWYYDDVGRQQFRLRIHEGRIYDAQGRLFDTRSGVSVWNGQGNAIFVMDEHGNLYASLFQQPGVFHHSSFLAGAPVAGAGELVVINGELQMITDSSGHYRPSHGYTLQVVDRLRAMGVQITRDQIRLTPDAS